MTRRHLATTLMLTTGALFFASQLPAQETEPPKKAPNKVENANPAPASTKPVVSAAASETKPSTPMNVQRVAKFIDSEIDKQLQAAKIAPSPVGSDAEFIRRVSLDIAGVVPSADRVEAFLADTDPGKRVKLVDELLAGSRYGQRLADIWMGQMVPADAPNRNLSKKPLAQYLLDNFNANKPWDRMASDLITASGDQDKNGAVTYYMVNPTVDKMTDSIGKLFLGVQIQCAQCHNHPFTHWKQAEYWGLAQFFYNVNVAAIRNNKDTTTVPGVSEAPRQNRGRGGNQLPDSAKKVPAKFLGGGAPSLTRGKPYRPVLADWLCTAENPFFSKATVNRLWSQYFGRGLVNPIDDLSDENEPTHPALLNGVAKEFAAGGFDLKNLVRAICLSNAYQRSSQPAADNKSDSVLYSHMPVKVLTPEQLYDSLTAVVGDVNGGGGGRGFGKGGGGAKGGGNVTSRERFATFFAGSDSAKATDYEAGIPQALRLMNNPRLSGSSNVLSAIAKAGNEPAKAINRLYLLALSRKATEAEVQKLTAYVGKASDTRTAYGDILWALLNSSEFALNH